MNLCKNLRWKGFREVREDPRELVAAFARNEVPYSCLHTTDSWGPDGRLACPERCGPERSCFVHFYARPT